MWWPATQTGEEASQTGHCKLWYQIILARTRRDPQNVPGNQGSVRGDTDKGEGNCCTPDRCHQKTAPPLVQRPLHRIQCFSLWIRRWYYCRYNGEQGQGSCIYFWQSLKVYMKGKYNKGNWSKVTLEILTRPSLMIRNGLKQEEFNCNKCNFTFVKI